MQRPKTNIRRRGRCKRKGYKIEREIREVGKYGAEFSGFKK